MRFIFTTCRFAQQDTTALKAAEKHLPNTPKKAYFDRSEGSTQTAVQRVSMNVDTCIGKYHDSPRTVYKHNYYKMAFAYILPFYSKYKLRTSARCF